MACYGCSLVDMIVHQVNVRNDPFKSDAMVNDLDIYSAKASQVSCREF